MYKVVLIIYLITENMNFSYFELKYDIQLSDIGVSKC